MKVLMSYNCMHKYLSDLCYYQWVTLVKLIPQWPRNSFHIFFNNKNVATLEHRQANRKISSFRFNGFYPKWIQAMYSRTELIIWYNTTDNLIHSTTANVLQWQSNAWIWILIPTKHLICKYVLFGLPFRWISFKSVETITFHSLNHFKNFINELQITMKWEWE